MKKNENSNIEYDYDENQIDLNRLSIIDEIFHKFHMLFNKTKFENIPLTFKNDKKICRVEISKNFKDIKNEEINYILFSFNFAKDRSVNNIINFLDTINKILSHFEYYKTKNKRIKYNNSHFDNYLLKRYESAYIFTEYITDRGGRELKIDNQLFFNYIPVECNLKKHTNSTLKQSTNPKEIEECPFTHSIIEEIYHPFVYKKFKCFKNQCKDDNCELFHVDKDDNPIDMETEVDFDSNEIISLQKVLASLKLTKEDIDKDEKLKIFLEKKAKDTGDFIPTEFNPLTYKIYKCPLGAICKLDKKLCFNYHNNNDRRRNPGIHNAKLCPELYENNKKIKDGKCKKGDDCEYSHNLYEYYYHPEKFRTVACPKEKKEKYCKERLICPYFHKTDVDCGEKGNKIIVDKKLITDYYKSLMVSYNNSINNELNKLNEIGKKYLCYLCGQKRTNALDLDGFYVDTNNNKIICIDCAQKRKIETIGIGW